MSFRARILAAWVGVLFFTVAVVWGLAGGGVLRPFVRQIMDNRLEMVGSVARELETTADPDARALELARQFHLDLDLHDHPPHPHLHGKVRVHRKIPPHLGGPRGGVLELDDGSTMVVVPLETQAGRRWLLMRFTVDLAAPVRRAAIAVAVVTLLALLVGILFFRWALAPLDLAADGMSRVAEGDLRHRLREGSDATGQISRTFNRMAERIEALIVGQRQLMAAVSHELRTPLTRMRLQVELMRAQPHDETRLSSLDADIDQMNLLVEELLESARLHQGVLALHRAPVRVRDLALSALGEVDLGERPITLEIDEELTHELDSVRIVRALSNALSNAARYTPAGTPVRFSADHLPDGALVLSVADEGPGVLPDSIDHLFDAFYREERSRSRATGGLGLGLMLVRQIAEAHGGTVSAKNREPHGFILEMRFPRGSAPS